MYPYVHTVGHRRGEYSYLTPNDALKALGNKLIDTEEKLPSGKLGAVFVIEDYFWQPQPDASSPQILFETCEISK